MFRVSLNRMVYIVLFALGVLYVLNHWSPSSYGYFLKQHGAENSGIIWGTPQPIRSDEWGVVTPYTQATVNNDFQRYNHTSLYNEDLRINYGMPIYDWGMLFKPTMWGYLFLDPATAFSVHWYLIFALFIIGYYKLFSKVGLRKELALLLSISIYFSGFSQFWWNEKGPVFAFFPWLLIPLLSTIKTPVRLALFFWFSTSWFLTDLYPPLVISLAFIGAIFIYCFGKEWLNWRKLAALGIAAALSVATMLLYLKDYLLATSTTIYPGHRLSSGGELPFNEWLSQILPFSTFDRLYNVFSNHNICEVGAVGFAFILMVIVHINYKNKWLKKPDRQEKKIYFIFFVALLAMNLWMIAPLPAWLGRVFLWDHVQPGRMKYAAGILLGVTVIFIAQKMRLVISWKRFAIYSAIIILAWIGTKLASTQMLDGSFTGFKKALHRNYTDLYTIVALLVSYLLIKYVRLPALTAFVLTSTLASAYVLFPFNAFQSSKAIFADHAEIKSELDPLVNKETGVLAAPGYFGATLNGLGYKSVTHVTPVPHLDFWRKMFPDMPQVAFDTVFNRYSHIILADVKQPETHFADQVQIPVSKFINTVNLPEKSIEQSVLNLTGTAELQISHLKLPAGKLISVAPLLGTYEGKSDGILNVEVCSSRGCQSAAKSLKNAPDNAYLKLYLDTPLDISKNDMVTITFKRSSEATQPLAFWSDISAAKTEVVREKTVSTEDVMPKLQLIYAGTN